LRKTLQRNKDSWKEGKKENSKEKRKKLITLGQKTKEGRKLLQLASFF
jgi:hypothetical protein